MGAWLDPHGHKFHSHVKQRGKKIEYELGIIDRFVIDGGIVFLNAIPVFHCLVIQSLKRSINLAESSMAKRTRTLRSLRSLPKYIENITVTQIKERKRLQFRPCHDNRRGQQIGSDCLRFVGSFLAGALPRPSRFTSGQL